MKKQFILAQHSDVCGSFRQVVYCSKDGSKVTCFPMTADGMTLSRGPAVVVPMRLPTITMTFMSTLVQLGTNRLLLCYNERITWAKNHALTCNVLEEKDGTWTLSSPKIIAEKMTNAYLSLFEIAVSIRR